jgi:hypothetical protein
MATPFKSFILGGGLAAFAVISASFGAFAADQTETATPPPNLSGLPPDIASAISMDAGVTLGNFYIERGVIIQHEGLISQPYADLYYKLYQGDGFINKVTATVGLWGDLSTAGLPSSPDATSLGRDFTEFDVIPGLAVQFENRFTLTTRFNQWFNPSGGYHQGRWVNTTLGFDDTGLTGQNFSIQPYLNVLYELPGPSYPGLKPHAWYFEPGISPNYTFFSGSQYPVNLAFPIAVGLGNRFYAGDTYGYLSVGPQVSVPLAFIPLKYGKWTASLGYRYINLGPTTAAIAPGGRNSQNQVIFTIGVQSF